MPEAFIFLYGPPASGKSSIGKLLAENLGSPFYDLDEEIERQAGAGIPDIFEGEGEAGFRGRETQALVSILERPSGVVALGGGALLKDENRALAETRGRVVCVSASAEAILERLDQSGGGRPLLEGDERRNLEALLEARREHYDSFRCRIPTDHLPLGAAAWRIQTEIGMFRVTGMGRPYDVRAAEGGLGELGELLARRELAGPLALVSDVNVARHHEAAARAALESAGFQVASIVLPGGEENKTLQTVEHLIEGFLQAGLERSSTLVALGGGVIGDLAGFAAAIYLRGMSWVAVPTSLLAMVDASLGGKTGADLPQGKNLVGAFHPPRLVLADPCLLGTLPEAELRNGLAEVVKHGVIADPQLFEQCQGGWQAVRSDWSGLVRRAMAVKLQVIEADPYEGGRRASLNLGHTLGHALELASGFRLKHGEAVGIGMVATARLSEKLGLARGGLAQEIEACLQGLGLPTRPPADLLRGVDRQRLLSGMQVDKKKRSGRLRLVLPVEVGEVRWGVEVDDPAELVESILIDREARRA